VVSWRAMREAASFAHLLRLVIELLQKVDLGLLLHHLEELGDMEIFEWGLVVVCATAIRSTRIGSEPGLTVVCMIWRVVCVCIWPRER
jgi:hypothetical protein